MSFLILLRIDFKHTKINSKCQAFFKIPFHQVLYPNKHYHLYQLLYLFLEKPYLLTHNVCVASVLIER